MLSLGSGVMELAMRGLLLACCLICLSSLLGATAAESNDEKLGYVRHAAVSFADSYLGDQCLLADNDTSFKGILNSTSAVRTMFDFVNGMVAIQFGSEKGEAAFVMNDKYCFEAIRLQGKDNWMLLDYAFDESTDIDTKKLGLSMAISRPTLRAYHSEVCGLPGLDNQIVDAEYLLSDDVTLASCTESDTLVEFSYNRKTRATEATQGERIDGTIAFSKMNHCLPMSLQEKTGGKSKKTERSYEYPSPQQMKMLTKDENYEAGKRTLLSLSADSFKTTPRRRADFTLTAFGLPEPAKPVSRIRQFFIWLAVTFFGAGCITLYFLLRKWRGNS